LGTLIRHVFLSLAAPIGALLVSVIEPACGTLLMASIRCAELTAACQIMASTTAVALPPIAVAADIEKLAASRGTAKSLTEDEFQGTSRRFPKAGLDNGPPAMAVLGCF
jgi:hypothetical protein